MKAFHRSADAVRDPNFYGAALAVALAAMAPALAADSLTGPLVLKAQGSFFVGGVTEHTDATTGTPGGFLFPNPDDIQVNQMYVQYQIPEGAGRHVPVVPAQCNLSPSGHALLQPFPVL